jgi:hypothetical protein
MKSLILTLATLLISNSVFALNALNCSNAERTFAREEQEIWGSNPIFHYVNGEKVQISKEVFDDKSINYLSRKIDTAAGSGEEIYSIKMILKYDDNKTAEDFVICRKWWDQLID